MKLVGVWATKIEAQKAETPLLGCHVVAVRTELRTHHISHDTIASSPFQMYFAIGIETPGCWAWAHGSSSIKSRSWEKTEHRLAVVGYQTKWGKWVVFIIVAAAAATAAVAVAVITIIHIIYYIRNE